MSADHSFGVVLSADDESLICPRCQVWGHHTACEKEKRLFAVVGPTHIARCQCCWNAPWRQMVHGVVFRVQHVPRPGSLPQPASARRKRFHRSHIYFSGLFMCGACVASMGQVLKEAVVAHDECQAVHLLRGLVAAGGRRSSCSGGRRENLAHQ